MRRIQRIKTGVVKPRAFTIKLISETLGFDFFETSITSYEVKIENQDSNPESHNLLIGIDCQVISNDGLSGSFGIEKLNMLTDKRFGFYRDYSPNSNSPFGTGLLDKE